MPFHVDRFFGSSAVQAMCPAARMGYLSLLARGQWQSEDGTVSADTLDLAEKSGLGDELWALYGPRILRNFQPVGDRLRNQVNFEEWEAAKTIFEKNHPTPEQLSEKRSSAGRKGNEVRWGNRKPIPNAIESSQIGPKTSHTGTGTGTGTQKPSASKSRRRIKPDLSFAKDPTKTAIASGRHAEFKAIIGDYWTSKNPGVQMPWDGREGKQLEMFLRAAPDITADQFRGFLRNRFKSEVNHGERCSMWIQWVTSYAAGPMDRFGKTITTQEPKNQQPKPKILSRPGE